VHRRLGESLSQNERFGEEKIFYQPGIETRFLCRPVRSRLNIPTESFRLSYLLKTILPFDRPLSSKGDVTATAFDSINVCHLWNVKKILFVIGTTRCTNKIQTFLKKKPLAEFHPTCCSKCWYD